ncbi:MAG: YecA family protein, partial [Burkholderiales bacterium]
MNAPSQDRPLTDAEIETLETRLAAIDPDDSMAVEELDGFFAALSCCPEPVAREEWLPMVLGDSPRAREALLGEGDDASLLKLVERHRAAVATMLYEGKGFAPVLAYDENGDAWGNAWAIGFARGMSMRPEAWLALEEEEDFADALDPVMRLVADAQLDGGDDDE